MELVLIVFFPQLNRIIILAIMNFGWISVFVPLRWTSCLTMVLQFFQQYIYCTHRSQLCKFRFFAFYTFLSSFLLSELLANVVIYFDIFIIMDKYLINAVFVTSSENSLVVYQTCMILKLLWKYREVWSRIFVSVFLKSITTLN